MFVRGIVRAGITIVAEVRAAVFAFVAAERESDLTQTFNQWEQESPAPRQGVLDVRGAAAVVAAFDERVAFHVAESPDEGAAADRMKRGDEFGRATRRAREIAHDEQRPLVADHLERARHRATVAFASPHN